MVQEIIDAAIELNSRARTRAIGTAGGTHHALGCDLSEFNASILVPGIGAQGGRMEDRAECLAPPTTRCYRWSDARFFKLVPTRQRCGQKVASYVGV